MNKKQLILVPSESMDNNKKQDRDEDALIRLSASSRDFLGLDDKVNVSNEKGSSLELEIFKAFVADLKKIKTGFSEEERRRIAFVTTDTYNKLKKKEEDRQSNIWISKTKESVVFGADPEFLIYSPEGLDIVPAYNLLTPNGPMGSDGAMAEVRPPPSKTPEGLVKNIQNILTSVDYRNIVENYILRANCYVLTQQRDYPIGGHIHIGNPPGIKKLSETNKHLLFKTMNKIMDELVSVPLIKLDGVPDGKNRRIACKMSTNGGYGYFGGLRTAGNGHDMRLEHRTLSGMWLIHPTVAKAVLGLTKAIIDEVWALIDSNNFDMEYIFPKEYANKEIWKTNFDGWKEFPICKDLKCVEDSSSLKKRLHESDPETITKTYLKQWLSKLKKMSVYNTYEKYISSMYEILLLPTNSIATYDKTLQNNWLKNNKFITD